MNVRTLLKLEIKNRFGDYKSAKNPWLKSISTAVVLVALVYGLYWAAGIFFRMFDKAGISYEALVIVYSVFFIFTLATGISGTTKVLYYKGDNEILMRYPVSGEEVFISKTLFLILSQSTVTVVAVAPFLVAYAEVMNVGKDFYGMIPVSILFLILIPFFLSNILAIPAMHFTNRVRNKFAFIIICLALIVTAMFAVYMLLFDKMVEFMNDSDFSVFDDAVVDVIKRVCKYLIPAKYFADILVGKELYIAYPVLIMLTAVTLVGTMLVIVKLYPKTLLNNIEVEGSAFRHVTRNHRRTVFGTLLHKEFLQVFRSVNYSFQYFVLACAMPVMVYFCNNITMQLGKNKVGEQIALGMTMLVMLIFATIVISFAATSVSREGDNFYHTKVAPVSVRTQLFAKFLMYFIVSVLSNGIGTGVLVFTKQLDWKVGLWLFAVVEMLSVGLTLISMRRDIKKPYFNLSGEGEVVNNNASTTLSVALGFVVAIVESVTCMILSWWASSGGKSGIAGVTMDIRTMYIVCSAMALVFLVGSILIYSINLNRDYNRIAK